MADAGGAPGAAPAPATRRTGQEKAHGQAGRGKRSEATGAREKPAHDSDDDEDDEGNPYFGMLRAGSRGRASPAEHHEPGGHGAHSEAVLRPSRLPK